MKTYRYQCTMTYTVDVEVVADHEDIAEDLAYDAAMEVDLRGHLPEVEVFVDALDADD